MTKNMEKINIRYAKSLLPRRPLVSFALSIFMAIAFIFYSFILYAAYGMGLVVGVTIVVAIFALYEVYKLSYYVRAYFQIRRKITKREFYPDFMIFDYSKRSYFSADHDRKIFYINNKFHRLQDISLVKMHPAQILFGQDIFIVNIIGQNGKQEGRIISSQEELPAEELRYFFGDKMSP